QRILAGQTMTVDFQLSSEVVQAEGIVATIEREPLVARDNTISKSRFTGEEARNLPVDDIESVITLGAGIYEDQTLGGFVIRGGRSSESATYVDGAMITDFSSQRNSVELSNYAVEEIDVITGGFNAEFGHAQSGIINIVTREGGPAPQVTLRFSTDELSGGIESSLGYNDLQISAGGPLAGGRLSYFGSFQATGAEDFLPKAAGFNPATGDQRDASGSTRRPLPGNRGDRTLAQAKLTAILPTGSRLASTYLFSRDQLESYQPSRGLFQFLSNTASRSRTHDVILGYDQTLFTTGRRSLSLQVRGSYHRSRFHRGTPLTVRMAEQLRAHSGRTGSPCGRECDVAEDAFEEDFLNYRVGDVEFFFEGSPPNSVFDLPALGRGLPDVVFGHPNLFFTRGIFPSFTDETERRYGIRVDLDGQLNRIHRAKVGLEWTWINSTHVGGSPVSTFLADVYDVDPRVAAAYVQDRLDYGDLVVDLGLRWDHWDPNTLFPALPGKVDCSIATTTGQCREAEVTEARSRSEWSPRIGVAHPVTDRTQVRLSYGRFYQLPELRHFFSSFLTDEGNTGSVRIFYGNPELDHVETTAFEAGVTHLLGNDMVLDVVGYNRDRRGAIRAEVFQARSIDPALAERRIFVNGDNGNVKGLDITVDRRFAGYWSASVSWSLQWARGTTSSPLAWATGFGQLLDDLEAPGVLLTPPNQLQPEDFDRLHNVNGQFMLQLPPDFGAGAPWTRILRNVAIYAAYSAQSGTPFTRTSPEGRPVGDLNSSRLPWIQSGDVRVSKAFRLGSAQVEVFTLVKNVLDRVNVLWVESRTGLPDQSGLEFVESRNPQISSRFRREESPAGFPVALTDILEEWRDEFSRQDLDGDGIITLAESQETLFRAGIASTNHALRYGEPRQVRFGVQFQL
ncbi:MAG TPA: TonB-dependent receptor, partial [Gemmatimonadota bacterium]|nr:TonB-dependent receptor [Gemmatimonadota bacterium]